MATTDYAGRHRIGAGQYFTPSDLEAMLADAQERLGLDRFERAMSQGGGRDVVRKAREAGVLELSQVEVAMIGRERVEAFAAAHNLTLRLPEDEREWPS